MFAYINYIYISNIHHELYRIRLFKMPLLASPQEMMFFLCIFNSLICKEANGLEESLDHISLSQCF